MSCVNIHVYALTDSRFGRLASLLGLTDADHARGKLIHLWMECTLRGETALPQWLVEQHLGPQGPAALIESELARWSRGRGDSKTRPLYLRGAEGRVEWYQRNQEQSSKGGKARAASASRVAGKFASRVAGEVTSPLSESESESDPKSESEEQREDPQPPKGGVPVFGVELDPRPKRRARGTKPAGFTETERASARVVLDKLGAQNGVRYSATDTHVGLIARQLRSGITVEDLRAVIGYCALEKQWKGHPKMHEYLRPETLFGPETITKYLDPARTWWATLPDDTPRINGHSPEAEAEPGWMRKADS